MKVETMRKELHDIIDSSDDNAIVDFYTAAKKIYDGLELSEEELMCLNERRNSYLSGTSKSFTWEEAKGRFASKAGVGH